MKPKTLPIDPEQQRRREATRQLTLRYLATKESRRNVMDMLVEERADAIISQVQRHMAAATQDTTPANRGRRKASIQGFSTESEKRAPSIQGFSTESEKRAPSIQGFSTESAKSTPSIQGFSTKSEKTSLQFKVFQQNEHKV